MTAPMTLGPGGHDLGPGLDPPRGHEPVDHVGVLRSECFDRRRILDGEHEHTAVGWVPDRAAEQEPAVGVPVGEVGEVRLAMCRASCDVSSP